MRDGVTDCSAVVGLEGALLTTDADEGLECVVHTVKVDQDDDCFKK